jgi:hypothetical protein
MHFLYIDEAGSTGANLSDVQQPIFVMAGLTVSDEKWRKTSQAIREKLVSYFGRDAALASDFELHACELLSPNGDGPFAGHDRDQRNDLALGLLELIAERGHYLFQVPVCKAKLADISAPSQDWGFDWFHPWQFAFSLQITMFEEFLRGPDTGSTSTGLAIVDHDDNCVEFVRTHTGRRQDDTGWKELKKIVEIGYSASSHANPLIQLTDLAAFTLKKYYELETAIADSWPSAARDFYERCKNTVWSRVKFKELSFRKLNVHSSLVDHAKAVRKPGRT